MFSTSKDLETENWSIVGHAAAILLQRFIHISVLRERLRWMRR
jgi:hypothetical protein